MFDLIAKAGLQPADLARLVNVSRTAVHAWQHRGVNPSKWIRPKLDKILDAIASAVEAGDLPLPPELSQRQRIPALVKVIIAHVQRRQE